MKTIPLDQAFTAPQDGLVIVAADFESGTAYVVDFQPDYEIPYDDELQQQLEDSGLADLRAGRPVVVEGVRDPARYNTAVWFAAKYGLRWTNVPFEDRVVIELDERG